MLTVIILNYNSAEHTLGLLRSLEKQTNNQFSVIVVDNDSKPNDRAVLGQYAASSPLALDIIYSETNRGYSGGNNLGIRKALAQGSQWILILNPDTTVPPEFTERIQAIADDEVAIWQFPLVEQIANSGQRIVYGGAVRWLKRTLPHISNYSLLATRYSLRPRTLYAIGAALLVHRDAFDRIGLLDERYFLYFEDADFSMRAHKVGIPVKFAREPLVHHGVSQVTGKLGAPLLLRYHARNALLFNKKHGPRWVRMVLPLVAISGIILQFTKGIVMPSRRVPSRAIMDGIIDFYAKRFGKIEANRH